MPSKSRMTPNYRHWRAQPLWTLTQAAYLLAGHIPPDDPREAWTPPLPKAETFHARIKMAIATGDMKSTYKVEGIREKSIKPSDVVRWAHAHKYRIPRPLRKLVTGSKDSDDLSTREKNTLLKLVGGMAAANYEWRPGVPGSASKGIEEDLDRLGISLTAETIHKYLVAAADHLPRLPPVPPKRP